MILLAFLVVRTLRPKMAPEASTAVEGERIRAQGRPRVWSAWAAPVLYLTGMLIVAVLSLTTWPSRSDVNLPSPVEVHVSSHWPVDEVRLVTRTVGGEFSLVVYLVAIRPTQCPTPGDGTATPMVVEQRVEELGITVDEFLADPDNCATPHVSVSSDKLLNNPIQPDGTRYSKSESGSWNFFDEDSFAVVRARASFVFPVMDPLLSVDTNGLDVYMARPVVSGVDPSTDVILTASDIGDVSAVQWDQSSSGGPWEYSASYESSLIHGVYPESVKGDQRKTFFSGVLAALAASFLLAFFQSCERLFGIRLREP